MSETSPAAVELPSHSPFDATAKSKSQQRWERLDRPLERISEWLNPILVKEARQALKSRQFVVTFALLLTFGWAWSLLGIALLSPGVYYAPGGRTMLTGYTLILLVPMLVVVPFSAFRSLAAEREDGTFELLSITSLNARQIVSGKLGSAVLQMIVYYSALAPCIAFTYLLRGVDVLMIVLILFYTFLLSVLLSSLGLLVATISRTRHWQVLLSVSLVIALVFADIVGSYVAVMVIWAAGSIPYDETYFWVIQLAVLTFYVSYLALFLWGAAAQISFASDNRSTKLRVILLIQQVLWVFWMSLLWLVSEDIECLYVMMVFASIHWYVAGSLMMGESGELSPRVKRSLPQTFLGRMLRTWFNPGSGTGYEFVTLNVWSLSIVAVALAIASTIIGQRNAGQFDNIANFSLLAAAYITCYLGVGRLLVILVRRSIYTGLVLPLLLQIILAGLGAFIPTVFSGWVQGFGSLSYTSLQVTNWVWTLIEAVEGNLWSTPEVPTAVFGFAGIMAVVQLILAMREVEQVRMQTPHRVLEDELELHPELAPVVHRPRSPWDDEEVVRVEG